LTQGHPNLTPAKIGISLLGCVVRDFFAAWADRGRKLRRPCRRTC